MNIHFTSKFQKRFQKLPSKVQIRFQARFDLFIEDSSHPSLGVHPLKGNLAGFRAFSVTGDYRVIYRLLGADRIELVDIGKHSQVYE